MGLVRTELVKLRTQRVTIVLLLLALVLPIARFLLFGLGARISDVSGFELSSEVLQREQLLTIGGGSTLILVLAIMGITGEYRHRTITWTFLGTPERERILLTKLLLFVALSLFYGAVVAALVTGCTMVLLSIEGVALAVPWDVVISDYAIEIARLGLAVGLAFGVGALIVNQIGAIVVVLVEPIATSIVFGLLPDVGRFLPTPALTAALAEVTFPGEGALTRPSAVLVVAAYLVGLNLAAIYLTKRRDVT